MCVYIIHVCVCVCVCVYDCLLAICCVCMCACMCICVCVCYVCVYVCMCVNVIHVCVYSKCVCVLDNLLFYLVMRSRRLVPGTCSSEVLIHPGTKYLQHG